MIFFNSKMFNYFAFFDYILSVITSTATRRSVSFYISIFRLLILRDNYTNIIFIRRVIIICI